MKRKYWLALSLIEGVGPIKIKKLLDHFKKPRNIWRADADQLKKVVGIDKLADEIVAARKEIDLEKFIARLKKLEIKYLTLLDKEYPSLLKEIYDPPPILYYRGQNIFSYPAVAIVGSRKASTYGRNMARKLAFELTGRGLTVVSGMARGIDSAAHQGALADSGQTIAVLGSGIDVIYPRDNRELYQQIQKKGLVISEFPPGVQPEAQNFPRRNRIISGLCRGVIVVEAASRSGSLITADLALEQGREVMAVPGNINRDQSRGTNNLIKKGAKMVTEVNDILEEIFYDTDPRKDQKTEGTYPGLGKEEKLIVEILQTEGEMQINDIISRAELPPAKVNTLLLQLELKGIVARDAGKKYVFKGLQSLLKPI